MTGNQYKRRIARYLLSAYGSRGIHLYEEVSLGTSIIGKQRRIDLLVVHPATGDSLALECKYQDSSGTADEKIPYALQDLATLRIPGVIAYAFLALMTVTSNDASVRRLGPRRWRRLHRVGSYYIWLIFLATTLPPSAGTAWMLLACLLVLALRIGAYQRATGKKLRV